MSPITQSRRPGRDNIQDNKRLTALYQAMRQICNTLNENYLNTIRFLLDHGADVNMENNDNSTPLHVASYYGSVKATQLLLDHGANIHAQNNRGETPFQVASVREHQGVVSSNVISSWYSSYFGTFP